MREEMVKMKKTISAHLGVVIILRSRLPRHYEAISETYTPIFWRKKARPR
jgi:uncharacterized protein Veg